MLSIKAKAPQTPLPVPQPVMDIPTLKISQGMHLPHWECHNAIYHISFRLADSVPQAVLDRWVQERESLIAIAEKEDNEFSAEMKLRAQYLFSDQIEKYLDAGHGNCYLRMHEIAHLVANSITHFDGVRYHLHAWCIMPNHVHIIVQAIPNFDLSKIIHSWKSFTAHKANQILGNKGAFWQPDAYNRIIRSRKEYHFQIKYTWNNPDEAGLENWPWRWKRENIQIVM